MLLMKIVAPNKFIVLLSLFLLVVGGNQVYGDEVPHISEMLKISIIELNKDLPKKIDEGINLISIEFLGKALTYNYELDANDKELVNLYKQPFTDEEIRSLCEQYNRPFTRMFEIDIKEVYFSTSGEKINQITVYIQQCNKPLKGDVEKHVP